MENQILSEIKELKKILSQLIGTSDLQKKDQFSKADNLLISLKTVYACN
jgi:hypothetical protein